MASVAGEHGAARAGAIVAVSIAAVCGLLHAAFNVYLAVSLGSGGQPYGEYGLWSTDRARPLLAAMAIMAFLVAVIPIPTVLTRSPSVLFWRAVCWLGGGFLVLYGSANLLLSRLTSTGIAIVPSNPGSSRYAEGSGSLGPLILTGHASGWDVLFVVWGAALLVALFLTRTHGLRPGHVSERPRPAKTRHQQDEPDGKLIDIDPPWNWWR